MVCKLSAILILLLMFFVYPAFGQKHSVDAGYRGDRYSFREYRPENINHLSQLPPGVLVKLIAHLKSRLSERFYYKLNFAWGKKIDLNELYRVEPSWKKNQVGSYDLTFYFSDRRKGLKAFYSKIVLDADGGVVEEISLPNIALYLQKAEIIPLNRAIALAEKNGFPRKRMSFDFEYNKELDSFTWIISDNQPVEADNQVEYAPIGLGTYRTIAIDATSGSVIKIYKKTILL